MDIGLLHQKIDSLPEGLKEEVVDYLDYLTEKKMNVKRNTPKFGSGKGFFTIKEGFDAPLDDFKEYMV